MMLINAPHVSSRSFVKLLMIAIPSEKYYITYVDTIILTIKPPCELIVVVMSSFTAYFYNRQRYYIPQAYFIFLNINIELQSNETKEFGSLVV